MKKIPRLTATELCFVSNSLDSQAVFQLVHAFNKENDVTVDSPTYDYATTESRLKGLIFQYFIMKRKDITQNTELVKSFMLSQGFKQITNGDRDIETILRIVND